MELEHVSDSRWKKDTPENLDFVPDEEQGRHSNLRAAIDGAAVMIRRTVETDNSKHRWSELGRSGSHVGATRPMHLDRHCCDSSLLCSRYCFVFKDRRLRCVIVSVCSERA